MINIISKEEFLKKHENVIKMGAVTKEFIEDIFNLFDMNNKTDIKTTRTDIRKMYEYLLKYKYWKYFQTEEWIDLIRQLYSSLEDQYIVDERVFEYFNDQILDEIYKVSFNLANDEMGCKDTDILPKERPKEFTLSNIINHEFINDYLLKYAYTNKAKEYLYLI